MEIRLPNVKRGYGIIGLMFKTKIDGLYEFQLGAIDKSLHTWFCFADMDAICVNSHGRVLQKLRMTPWKIYNCDEDTTHVIEGKVDSFKILSIGDIVKY